MRPRKVILCVDDDESRLSVRSYMLEINGYRVLAVTESEAAIYVFEHAEVDLVLVDAEMPLMNGLILVTRLKEIKRHIPMILFGKLGSIAGQIHDADAFLNRVFCTPTELLERAKIMCARKRGPRPGTPKIVRSEGTVEGTTCNA